MTLWTWNCSKSAIQHLTRAEQSARYWRAEITRDESKRTSLRTRGSHRGNTEPTGVALRPAKACGKEGEGGYDDNDSGGHDDGSRIRISARLFNLSLQHIWRLFGSDALR